MTDPFAQLCHALAARSVRYVLIGVAGANLYAPSAGASFVTKDYDLFLPLDQTTWCAPGQPVKTRGSILWLADDPLDRPRDQWLAWRIIERLALTRVTGPPDLEVDLTLVMQAFDFQERLE